MCAIFGVCEDPVGIVMEYVSGGSLLQCIANEKIQLNTEKVIKFASDIASGMSHLHAENIIHLDLGNRNSDENSLTFPACRNLLVNFGYNNTQQIKVSRIRPVVSHKNRSQISDLAV